MSRKTVDQASDESTNAPQFRTGFDGRRSMTLIWIEKIMSRLPEEFHPYVKKVITFVRRLASSPLNEDGAWKALLPYTESRDEYTE